jgi:hypothetical protein
VNKEKDYTALTYAVCTRCEHYQGCHSTIFGECWICSKGVKEDVFDNNWHFEMGEPIIPCEHFSFGEPSDNYVG